MLILLFLISLEAIHRLELILDNLDNLLVSKRHERTLPIIHKRGHLYVIRDFSEIMFTESQFTRLHLQFFHPSAAKLYYLIRRARREEAATETRDLISETSKQFRACQHFETRASSFHVTKLNEIIFNQDLALDIMLLDKSPVVYIVDPQTHFGDAVFLRNQRNEFIWTPFLEFWTKIYTGFPDRLKVEQGGQLLFKA